MWTFEQATGRILGGNVFLARGQSGQGAGLNNPAMERVHNVGPIPRGFYDISFDVENTVKHGPYVLRLTPREGTDTHGRSGFLIHGLAHEHPELSSEGCICVSPAKYRMDIHESRDYLLEVVSGAK